MKYRKEFDSIGSIKVPDDKYWGASTQRSNKYFDIGDFLVRPIVIKSIAIIKKAAAIVHAKDKQISPNISKAIIKACETVDSCVERVVKTGLDNDYAFVIIADHGNSDNMLNLDGSQNTAHSMNPVPCIVIDDRFTHIQHGSLADVSPTLLKMMGVKQPKEMTGKALV